MGKDELSEIKQTSSRLVGKLQDLSKVSGEQKKVNKMVKEISKLRDDLEKEFQQLKPFLEKKNINPQVFNNTTNGIKRALNQPNDSNIQNAVTKMNEFINKLAA